MIQNIRKCPACEELFLPDRYHPRQRYCLDPSCRISRKKLYKQAYNQQWRDQNPTYYRDYWLAYRELK